MDRIAIAHGLTVSRLVYGLWRLADDPDTSPAHVAAKIDACLAQGITTMDHADIYGGYRGERIFGDALRARPDLRERIEIVTKCGIVAPFGRHEDARVKHYDTSARHIRESLDRSLTDLGTERIDLLLVHRPDPLMDHLETARALDAAVASGKARAVGVSNFRPFDVTLLQSTMREPLVVNQIEIGLAATDPFRDGDLAFLQERRIVPMAWSPLGGGSLFDGSRPALTAVLDRIAAEAGTDPSAIAVAWLLAHPARIVPVLGTNRLERIQRIGEASRFAMSRETWFELYAAATGRDVP